MGVKFGHSLFLSLKTENIQRIKVIVKLFLDLIKHRAKRYGREESRVHRRYKK